MGVQIVILSVLMVKMYHMIIDIMHLLGVVVSLTKGSHQKPSLMGLSHLAF